MIFGAGSKVLSALILTNLWTLILLFLAWNHTARHEVVQGVSNVGEWLGLPPDRAKWSPITEDPLTSVHQNSRPIEGNKGDEFGVVTATQTVGPARDPNLPAFCPECGEGDLLCARYGLVSSSALNNGLGPPNAHTPAS